MNTTLQNLMREATRLTQSGNLKEATRVIQRALGKAEIGDATTSTKSPSPPPSPPVPTFPSTSPIILDGCVFEVAPPQARSSSTSRHDSSFRGEFVSGTHTHASLTRRYKLYTPPASAGESLPLLVMLHGCTQNPDDFAVGTGMNELARQQGYCVLYPEQPANANPQRCWNWFKHNHQSRGRGEAALLASMTLEVIKQHGMNESRIYIAGLSAGGAMAAIMAAAYPEIYAAVGVHSGLAVGAASNVSEALAAMNVGAVDAKLTASITAVPTIVFHGDNDRTVHPRNGEQVIAAIAAISAGSEKSVEKGESNQGQRFTRT